jgi:hypothetical protein
MNSGSSRKQSASSKLPNSLEMLRRVANFRYYDEEIRSEAKTEQEHAIRIKLQAEKILVARNATIKFLPELWDGDDDRALQTLRIVRNLLQRFWCEKDERRRDWYIHRCRFFYRQLTIQGEFREDRDESWRKLIEAKGQTDREYAQASIFTVYAKMDRALDIPPEENPFESALYALQERARKPSRAPRCCHRNGCSHPYFFANKKSRKFCSPECARLKTLESKRDSWDRHKDEWRTR